MKSFKDIANPGVMNLAVYEPGRPIEEVAREIGFTDPDQVIKLASNENALGPSPKAVSAIRKMARRMHLYPDGGAYYLKQALSSRLNVDPSQIVATNGSNEVLELLAHVFLGPGTGIVMADRAFVVYRLVAAACGAAVVSVPMRDLTHDLDAMLAAIRPDTKIVFISNPNNPTSTMVGQKEVDRFMDQVPDHVITCFDEAYIELLPPEKQPDTLKFVRSGRKVVVARTFSKTYGLAGLRLGYAVAPADCIALFNRVRQPFNVNAMAMEAALAALGDEAYVARTRRMIVSGIRQLQDGFKRMGLSFIPASVNFVLVKVGNGRKVFHDMQKEGIILRPMDQYMLPEYVRVTVGKRTENAKCLAALKKVLGLK